MKRGRNGTRIRLPRRVSRRLAIAVALFVSGVIMLPAVNMATQATFRLDGFRGGDTFSYDGRVDSTVDNVGAYAQNFLRIMVGSPTWHALPSGRSVEVVAVQTERRATEWDVRMPPRWNLPPAHSIRETVTEHIATPGNMVIQADTFVIIEARENQRTESVTVEAGSTVLDGSVARFRDAMQELHGQPYVYYGDAEPPWVPASVLGRRAELSGDTVYRAQRERSQLVEADEWPACSIPFPAVDYAERPPRPAPGSALFVTERTTTWLSPFLPVPVRVECVLEYRLALSPGRPIAAISLELHLAEWTRGSIALGFSHEDAFAIEQVGVATAQPVLAPGLPAGGNLPLDYHLDDAYSALLTSTDAGLAEFRSPGSTPFLVLSANYRPQGSACRVPGSVDGCLGGSAPLESSPTWTFELQNLKGERLSVEGWKRVGPDGQTLDSGIRRARGNPTNAPFRSPDDFPAEMVPLAGVLRHWQALHSQPQSTWRADPEARIEVTSLNADAQSGGIVYRIHWTGTTGEHRVETFDPRHGALLSSSWAQRRSPAPQAAGVVDRPDTQMPAPQLQELPWHIVALAFIGLGGLITFWPSLRAIGRGGMALLLGAKVRRETVRLHPYRQRMCEVIAAEPGITTRELSRRLEIAWGETLHHLHMLERHGFVESHKEERFRGWFLAGKAAPNERRASVLLRSSAARRVYEAILSNPDATQRHLAELLNLDHSTVWFQARRLVSVGLVEERREGRNVRYGPIRERRIVPPKPSDWA